LSPAFLTFFWPRFSACGGEQHQRVRRRSVAVHRHRVERGFHAFREQLLQRFRRDRGVGEDIGQHGRMSGRSCRALGHAIDRDLHAVDFALAVATFGKVSVVMIAWRRRASRRAPLSPPACPARLELAGVERSPMTRSRPERSRSRRRRPPWRRASPSARSPRGRLAGEGVGVAGIDHRARARPPLRLSRHQSTGADGHLDVVNTPATVAPSSNTASSTSVRHCSECRRRGARRTPSRPGSSAKVFGASGETGAAAAMGWSLQICGGRISRRLAFGRQVASAPPFVFRPRIFASRE